MEKPQESIRLSVSKTKSFVQCKKQFEFSYILKMPKKTRDYHIFGQFCHKVLEDFHIAYINGSNEKFNVEMGRAFKNALTEFTLTPEMKKECWDIINRYLLLVIKQSNENSLPNVLSCEKNFYLNLNEQVILNGMIDRIQLDPDGILHVADYKTTKNKKYLKDDFFQLLTYAFVLVSEDPSIKKVRASYILLRHDFEYITTEFSIDDILKVKQKYIDYGNQILNEKEFEANPTILCDYCDFNELCDKKYKGSKNNFKIDETVFGETNW